MLGPHALTGVEGHPRGWCIRVFLPGAESVQAVTSGDHSPLLTLDSIHADGVFEGLSDAGGAAGMPRDYRLAVTWADGTATVIDDPYRHSPLLGEVDVWLLAEGSHRRPCEVLGATPRHLDGVDGTGFAVWAPNASRVSVVGDFNFWDGRRHPMRLRRECGVWEIFLPGVGVGARYKFEIRSRDGRILPLKSDPHALQAELRPATASIVARLPERQSAFPGRQAANALDAPVSIYEVHVGSWRRKVEGGVAHWLDWDELADSLVPYARNMGFTHLELMPIGEHPFDGSWGYQPVGLYAPTARYGDPAGFARFVARCHAEGLGLLLDWVPAHFPADDHGLRQFDGTHLYDYADPREGFHNDWNTLIYNFGRTEVRNHLVGNALYWLERFGVDGLRVDAVASMLYRDYSREPGEWISNVHGGRENLEAIDFLKQVNAVVGIERPEAITLAEESTSYPAVSRPTYAGGLGFHYKWNMGWMNDTLQYMARDPIHRKHHHSELTFSMVYAYTENFVLPLSHDEVVHGKGSLLSRMPGDRWQKFANLRAYLGFMYAHPGKKLLFMGGEFAQVDEWHHDRSLDWHLLADRLHEGVQRLVHDLNHHYRESPALYQRDFDRSGFEWIEHNDAERSLLAFIRRGHDGSHFIVAVCNFTPTVQAGYRLGVPRSGIYSERLNTDSSHYGGSNAGTPYGVAATQETPWQGQTHSIVITVPPLATVLFEWRA